METLDYILDGLEQWLEVERECGVRSLEVDRSLLVPAAKPALETAPVVGAGTSRPAKPSSSSGSPSLASSPDAPASIFDFVFLHDKPLTPAGAEMMANIVKAMGRTADTAPVILGPPIPQARAYIVLGALALRKYFLGVRGEPGQWVRTPDGKDALITYSPAFILRFPTVTDAVKKMKRDMWTSLKGVMQRFNGGRDGK